ncbi:MAG: exosortase-associated EpsI family protein [Deltaproteobacteria bacterium]|nr:exosortase-associated EpsI family protein [Deltaproteobacteria bacterium]
MSGRLTAEILAPATLVGMMLVVGDLSWLRLSPRIDVDATSLGRVPTRSGSWQSRRITLNSDVEAELQADCTLQRVFVSPTSDHVWLYLGFYGTERGDRGRSTGRAVATRERAGASSPVGRSTSPKADLLA